MRDSTRSDLRIRRHRTRTATTPEHLFALVPRRLRRRGADKTRCRGRAPRAPGLQAHRPGHWAAEPRPTFSQGLPPPNPRLRDRAPVAALPAATPRTRCHLDGHVARNASPLVTHRARSPSAVEASPPGVGVTQPAPDEPLRRAPASDKLGDGRALRRTCADGPPRAPLRRTVGESAYALSCNHGSLRLASELLLGGRFGCNRAAPALLQSVLAGEHDKNSQGRTTRREKHVQGALRRPGRGGGGGRPLRLRRSPPPPPSARAGRPGRSTPNLSDPSDRLEADPPRAGALVVCRGRLDFDEQREGTCRCGFAQIWRYCGLGTGS